MNTIVDIKGVNKIYGTNHVVKDLNLLVEEGEFLTLLGSSGCGKTTTLRMIAGFEEPTTGSITVEGEPIEDKEPYERNVNTVFQSYALFPHMTIYDNVAYGLRMKKVPKKEIKERVLKMLEMVQLSGFEKRYPSQLSGGQKQRVAIARALINRPKVLLLDEPLGALDLKLRKQMQLELKRLQKKLNITFIYVTHDQTEAMTLGTRIVVLKDGVIMQVDSPQKLYNEPNNLFVAGFIGSPQMNFIDAVCKVEGERVTLNFEKTSVVLPPAKAKKLIDGGYNGKTVVMGIRPEDIGDSQIEIEAHKDAVFETDVTGYELLGSEVLLYFNVAGTAMTAKVDSRTTARMGDHITLAIDPEKIHCFDKETELTITN